MNIEIDSLGAPDTDGIRITDHIENAQFDLYTPAPVEFDRTDSVGHYFPVDASISFETPEITVPRVATVAVRDGDGELIEQDSEVDLPAGTYHVEIMPTPTKTYLSVDGPITVTPGVEQSRISFGDSTVVSIGFRSLHEQPSGTITTPTDPESLMRAVSRFGSALATLSPERSFPTLRGHPPLLEPGSEFTVPDGVGNVDSGLTVVVPPEYEYVYPTASIAYYLGAEVVPGDRPRLEADGWEFDLAPDFQRRVSRLLRQTFHLDCLVRTAGFYSVDLQERRDLEARVDLDVERLYDLPIDRRLPEYLEIPFATIEPLLPQWPLTTDVQPVAEHCSFLPYVAADLSLIRCPDDDREVSGSGSGPSDGFFRSTVPRTGLARSGSTADKRTETAFVRPREVETTEHAWVGDGVPTGANKATLESYRRRIREDVLDKSYISVTVVCNDDRMREEGEVAELYGLRDMFQFEIDVAYDLSRSEMRDLLSREIDFLHYIGHVDGRGMRCSDGFLDLTDESIDVGVESFLLNACQSYRQGQALIDLGSRGGIVTIADVANSSATRLGRIVARLMNGGFNLRTALHVAQRDVITGYQYCVLGDGGVLLCQSRSGPVCVLDIGSSDLSEPMDVTLRLYPVGNFGTGTIYTPYIDSFDRHVLVPSETTLTGVSPEEIERFLGLEVVPVFCDKRLRWSDEILPVTDR